MATDDRERLSATFDQAASLYQRARPDYPEEIVEELLSVTGMQSGGRVLEVGCATGKATLPLARRGLRVTCIEPGQRLAAVAKRNLSGLDVEILQGRFEDWEPRGEERFDLVVAATSWQWVDPRLRYARAWEALTPDGHLAVWDAVHVFPDGGDPFFREIQEVYEDIGEGLPAGAQWPRPGELPEISSEIGATGLFEVVCVRQFDWERTYDADSYIELLETFSGHIAMEPWKRERLYGEIRTRLADRPDGTVRRHWGSVLHIARRLG
ncbi:MAG TPA: class I SAM-dependent methyltransferase [Actinomycetota bacterium]|nr:class I SAM-dependent methyltransferase [Actinomycetota bacterium]